MKKSAKEKFWKAFDLFVGAQARLPHISSCLVDDEDCQSIQELEELKESLWKSLPKIMK